MLLPSSISGTEEYAEGNMNNQKMDGIKEETANGLSVEGKIKQG